MTGVIGVFQNSAGRRSAFSKRGGVTSSATPAASTWSSAWLTKLTTKLRCVTA